MTIIVPISPKCEDLQNIVFLPNSGCGPPRPALEKQSLKPQEINNKRVTQRIAGQNGRTIMNKKKKRKKVVQPVTTPPPSPRANCLAVVVQGEN